MKINTPKPIPVDEGKRIAKKYGYHQVIIIARGVGENGSEHVTTFGVNVEHCNVAARIGNFLKFKIMGWESSNVVNHQHIEG